MKLLCFLSLIEALNSKNCWLNIWLGLNEALYSGIVIPFMLPMIFFVIVCHTKECNLIVEEDVNPFKARINLVCDLMMLSTMKKAFCLLHLFHLLWKDYFISNSFTFKPMLYCIFRQSDIIKDGWYLPMYSLIPLEKKRWENRWIHRNIFRTIFFIKISMADGERWLTHHFSIMAVRRVKLPMLNTYWYQLLDTCIVYRQKNTSHSLIT